MDIHRSIIILVLSLGFMACTSMNKRGNLTNETNAELALPFDLIDNRIFVDVYLNHQGPFKFIFDTSSTNVMSPDVVEI